MAKYAPVVLRNNSDDTFVSSHNYHPIDVPPQSAMSTARSTTLWEDEETGMVVRDVEKFEKWLDTIKTKQREISACPICGSTPDGNESLPDWIQTHAHTEV